MVKFLIEDWTGKVLFGKCFDSFDDALEYKDMYLEEDETEDVFVLESEGEIRNGKFYKN